MGFMVNIKQRRAEADDESEGKRVEEGEGVREKSGERAGAKKDSERILKEEEKILKGERWHT